MFDQSLVRLPAGNPDLSTLVSTLLSDPDYKIAAIVPYGHDLSQIATTCVVWTRVTTT